MANVKWDTANKSPSIVLSNGNLTAASNSGAGGVLANHATLAGTKRYFEIVLTSGDPTNDAFGVQLASASFTGITGVGLATIFFSSTTACAVSVNNTTVIAAGSFGAVTTGAGVAIGVALDTVNQNIWFRVGASANWNGAVNGNPATNTGGASLGALANSWLLPRAYVSNTGHSVTLNSGDTAFAGAVPSGFTAGYPELLTAAGATTALSEQWIMPNANAQATSVFLEMWAPGGTTTPRAVATLVALEQWFTVAPDARGGPMVSMIW